MQKRALIFSSVLLGSSLAVFAACSGDSGGTPEDAGADSGTSTEDSGMQGMDSGPGMDATMENNDSGAKNDSGSTGNKMDSGSTTADSGSTSTDSGSASMDSGSMDSGSTSMDAGDSSTPVDSGTDTGSPAEDAGFDAGYITLDFDPSGFGSPDAIYWDNANQILYIVDDTNNQVWTYTDSAGFQKYAQVPDNAALTDAGKTKLNGVTELADGTLVITRFGYGSGGALYTVSPDGGTTTVPNVPGGERRIEVTVDPSTGVIYGDAFVTGTSGPAGKVEIVDLANGVTTYATGFGKTVGLLTQNDSVLVSDQSNNVIVAVPTDSSLVADGGATLADGGLFPVYANVSGPDQLSPGPNGSIYTDQFQSSYDGGGPQVRQVWPDGGVTIPYPNVLFTSLSDVAYDSTNSRLFVVDNNGTTVRTIKIFPVAM